MTTQSNGASLFVQGRIVWVSGKTLFEGNHKQDFNTKQPLFDQAGQPIKEYGFGLAIPKVDPRTGQNTEEFVKVWQALHAEAFTLFPSGHIPPSFAMKFKDGDSIDDKGRPFSERDGYAGHIVLACVTRIPIKFYIYRGGNNELVNTGIKCGDYVNVQLNIKAHPAKGQGKAGLYVSPNAVQLIQAGQEIINQPSGDQLFGQAAPAAYNGQVIAPTMAPMPVQEAPQAPVAPAITPHYAVLPQAHHPAPAPQAPAMPSQHFQQAGYGQAPLTPQAPAYPSNPMGPVGNVPAPMPSTAAPAQPAYPSNPSMPPMPGMPTR